MDTVWINIWYNGSHTYGEYDSSADVNKKAPKGMSEEEVEIFVQQELADLQWYR